MEILDLDPKRCVVCGKSGDYRVGLINSYELMVDSETKMTLTGTRTSRAYRFGPPAEAEAGLCLRCLHKAGRHDAVVISVAFAFLFAFLGIIGTLLVFLVASVVGPGNHWDQAKVVPWAFGIGYAASAALCGVLLAKSLADSRRKSKGEAEDARATAASVARFTLNKKRMPGGPRWFTPKEWEDMLATGIHPDSEEAMKARR
jgi:hypothetical protein